MAKEFDEKAKHKEKFIKSVVMTEETKWNIGDIVQIDPEHDDVFGGCFMVVTEPKSWGGAQGYFPSFKKGVAYYRVKFEDAVRVGNAEWILEDCDLNNELLEKAKEQLDKAEEIMERDKEVLAKLAKE